MFVTLSSIPSGEEEIWLGWPHSGLCVVGGGFVLFFFLGCFVSAVLGSLWGWGVGVFGCRFVWGVWGVVFGVLFLSISLWLGGVLVLLCGGSVVLCVGCFFSSPFLCFCCWCVSCVGVFSCSWVLFCGVSAQKTQTFLAFVVFFVFLLVFSWGGVWFLGFFWWVWGVCFLLFVGGVYWGVVSGGV